MRVLNFGSLNYDHVFHLNHFVKPGKTAASDSYAVNFGGKGLNQSIALAKAGMEVYHAGRVGSDGQPLIDYLNSYEVDTEYLMIDDARATGLAMIQVADGENCIVLYGGTNQMIDEKQIDETLRHFSAGDYLLIQNEISSEKYLIQKAHDAGMKIVFNAAPMNDDVFQYPLDLIDLFFVNEIEGQMLCGSKSAAYADIFAALQTRFPHQQIVMTCGSHGSYWIHGREVLHQEAIPAVAVDTTAAGDTFTGFYIAVISKGMPPQQALLVASKASSIAVSRQGAASSIPTMNEVLQLH